MLLLDVAAYFSNSVKNGRHLTRTEATSKTGILVMRIPVLLEFGAVHGLGAELTAANVIRLASGGFFRSHLKGKNEMLLQVTR